MSDTSNVTNPLIDKILDVLTCWREDDFRDAPSLEPSAEGWESWDENDWDQWAVDEVAKILADRKPPEPPPDPPKPAKSNADAPPPKIGLPDMSLATMGELRKLAAMLEKLGGNLGDRMESLLDGLVNAWLNVEYVAWHSVVKAEVPGERLAFLKILDIERRLAREAFGDRLDKQQFQELQHEEGQ